MKSDMNSKKLDRVIIWLRSKDLVEKVSVITIKYSDY